MGKGRRHNGNDPYHGRRTRPEERRRAGRPGGGESYRARARLLSPNVSRQGGQGVVFPPVSTLGQRAQRGCPCENPGPMALFFVAFLIFLPGAIMTANGYGEPEAIARRDPLLIVGPVSIGVAILLMLLSCGWNLYIQNNENDTDIDVEQGEDYGPASPDPASFSPPPSYDTIVHEDENSFPDQPTIHQEEVPEDVVPSVQTPPAPRVVLTLVEIPNDNYTDTGDPTSDYDPWVAREDLESVDEDIVHPPPSYSPVDQTHTASSEDLDDVFEEEEEDEDIVHPPPSYDEVMHVIQERSDDV
ncbi:Hypp5112 [Branchiostoma lanceolatum]|uniref:Hypp5112 protein n=1 Tax=Branchiostoma lanceolatum TaxID=7740 RepID=A0A8K0F3G2_BRALA|nr:Hypp5112 [Branchiostoma lanceolatum]